MTRVALDRELKAVYEVTAEVHDEGRPPRHARATVRVLVTDVNDNSPTFIEPREPSVSVREEQPAGTEVLQVSAGLPTFNIEVSFLVSILRLLLFIVLSLITTFSVFALVKSSRIGAFF